MSPELTSDALLRLLALTLLHGTALALLTWAAEVTLLRRCRPSVKAALWAVVLVKFLLPPVLPGSFGLSALIGSLGPGAQGMVTRAPQNYAPGRTDEVESAAASPLYERAVFSEDARPPSQKDRRSYLPGLLLSSYAALLLILITKALVHARRAGRRVRRLPAADSGLADEVCALARRVGLRRAPPVRLDEGAASPYVIGAWSPTLVLPAALPARLDPRAREALIIHELAHIRRGDLLVRWLQNTARLFLFFWPPVWWLCRRIERFSEMACDQWAVRFSSASPRLYAESLLDVAKGVRAGALLRHELGFATRRSGLLRARFESILGGAHEASPLVTRQVSALLLGWGLFALTGSVVAGGENHARVAGDDAPSLVASAAPTPEGSAVAGDERAPAAQADAAQLKARERRRAEGRARAERRTKSAGRAVDDETRAKDVKDAASEEISVTEVSPLQTARAQSQRPVTRAPDDLDGDGKVSHFEAGFSAGRHYDRRRRSRPAAGCAPCEPCPDCAASERRRQIELGARRPRFTNGDLP